MALRADGWARAALFALAPAASAGGGLALAPLLGLAGAAAARPSPIRAAITQPRLWLCLLLAFAGWMAASALWSPFEHAMQALKFALVLVTGLMFAAAAGADADARRLTRAACLAAVTALALLLAIEAVWDMPLNRAANPEVREAWQLAGNPGRGAAVLTSLVWASLGWLAARRLWLGAAALLALAAVLAAQFGQSANIAAFALGAAAFALGYSAPRAGILLTGFVFAAWLLLAPVLTPLLFLNIDPDALPYSWAARIAIWDYVCAEIAQRPLLGHGLDASRTVSDQIIVHGMAISAIPLHPHSASLQIWFETGAVGALLASGALAAGAWRLAKAWRANRAGAAAACGALTAIGVIANVSFGVWQEWWNAAILIAAAAVTGLSRAPQAP